MSSIATGLASLILHTNPIPWFTNLLHRGNDGIATVPIPGKRTYWLVGDTDLAHTVMTNRRAYDKAGPLYAILNEAMGDEGLFTVNDHDLWRTLRERINPTFARARHPDMVRVAAATWNARIDAWDTREPIGMFAEFKRANAELLVHQLFGSQVGASTIVDLAEPVFEQMASELLSPRARLTGMSRHYRAAIDRMDTHVYALIQARRDAIDTRATPIPAEQRDMLDRLMTGPGRCLSDKQLRDQVFIFFLAGFDSTATALAWAIIGLAEDPNLARRLRIEVRAAVPDPRHITPADFRGTPGLVDFFTGVLGDHPPFRLYFRNVVTPQRLGEHDLAPGDQVIVMSKEAAIPFGVGGRKCIGENLAQMSALTMLAITLLRTEALARPKGHSATAFTFAMITPPGDGARITVRPATPRRTSSDESAAAPMGQPSSLPLSRPACGP